VKITVSPFSTDVNLGVVYKEPMLGLAQEELRLPLVREILNSFECRLDDLKFDANHLSGKYIQFSKYYGRSLFSLQFGLEETSASIFKVEKTELAFDICEKLSTILDEIPIGSTRLNISRHFTSKEDINSFLKSLNPTISEDLRNAVVGRGVFYNLQFPDIKLNVFVTVVNSLLARNGLFFGMENQFLSQPESLKKSAEVVLEKHDFILQALGITLEEG